mgnify:CR=1 FL=1|tara:strand:+ start:6590 stop:6829 length:240 start_codon:yes stop_codon:yes gene_type:complete
MTRDKIYKVNGYWLDSNEEFQDYLIVSTDELIHHSTDRSIRGIATKYDLTDEDIFYYGMNVPKEMGNHEFKITDFEVMQ